MQIIILICVFVHFGLNFSPSSQFFYKDTSQKEIGVKQMSIKIKHLLKYLLD